MRERFPNIRAVGRGSEEVARNTPLTERAGGQNRAVRTRCVNIELVEKRRNGKAGQRVYASDSRPSDYRVFVLPWHSAEVNLSVQEHCWPCVPVVSPCDDVVFYVSGWFAASKGKPIKWPTSPIIVIPQK